MVVIAVRVRAESRTIGSDIGVCAANTVIQTRSRVDVDLKLRVVRVAQVSLLEILLNSLLLVVRLGEVVRESTCRAKVGCGTAEIDMHDALRVFNGLILIDHRAADGGYVWAVAGVLWVEDLLVRAEAAVGRAVTCEGSHTVVTRSEENRVTLQTELQEFVTLALGIADGEISFGLAVGGANDVGGLVNAALELPCKKVRKGPFALVGLVEYKPLYPPARVSG